MASANEASLDGSLDEPLSHTATPSASAAIVLAMLAKASEQTRVEVFRLLAADLDLPPTASELRVAELGFLSSLLTGPVAEGSTFVICSRQGYDNGRPPSAPSSRRLVERYGSWSRACRAAYGLLANGKTNGPGKPWATTNRGEHGAEPFTRDEALAAVKQCAEDLRSAGVLVAPTSWQYDEWVRRRKVKAKKTGTKLRLPYAAAIYRLFPKARKGMSRWKTVLTEADLL